MTSENIPPSRDSKIERKFLTATLLQIKILSIDDIDGPSNPQTDNTTDHFVVIVGMGTDTKGNYFSFYDNASNEPSQGANTNNKLYFDSSTSLIKGISNFLCLNFKRLYCDHD